MGVKTCSIIVAVLASVFLVGCGEKTPDLQNFETYRKGGVSFHYPGNWTISDGVQAFGVHHLTVESPGNAIVIVQVFPDDETDLMAYVKEFSSEGEASVGSVEASNIGPLVKNGPYETVTEKFSITVLGQTVPHVRQFHRRWVGGHSCTLIAQVAEEDHATVEPAFLRIIDSFAYSPESKQP